MQTCGVKLGYNINNNRAATAGIYFNHFDNISVEFFN